MPLPFDPTAAFGKARMPVLVRIGEHPEFRTTIAVYGGQARVGLRKDQRRTFGVGDTVRVRVAADDQPRVVEVPDELRAALAAAADAAANYEGMSFTHRKEYARWVCEAEKAETRQSRAKRAVVMLRDKRSPTFRHRAMRAARLGVPALASRYEHAVAAGRCPCGQPGAAGRRLIDFLIEQRGYVAVTRAEVASAHTSTDRSPTSTAAMAGSGPRRASSERQGPRNVVIAKTRSDWSKRGFRAAAQRRIRLQLRFLKSRRHQRQIGVAESSGPC